VFVANFITMENKLVRRCCICETIELEAAGEFFFVQKRDYDGKGFTFTDGLLSEICFKKVFPAVNLDKLKTIAPIYKTCGDYD